MSDPLSCTLFNLTHCQQLLDELPAGLSSISVNKAIELLRLACASQDVFAQCKGLLNKPLDGALLCRSDFSGYQLLTHCEPKDFYRPPHNHGAGWVVYAVLQGQLAMNTFKDVTQPDGSHKLVSRGAYVMSSGDCSAFLPGDIHDTRCLSEKVIMLRLTSCDFEQEKMAGRMVVYKSVEALTADY